MGTTKEKETSNPSLGENMTGDAIGARDNNRVELWKVAPRSVPFALGLAASDICNFKCIYCGHSTPKGIKDARILTWDDFLIIAHQIEELLESGKDDLKIIRFIGNGEPLVNKLLPDMVRYISERKYTSRIEVTTNGSLLTHEVSDALLDSGLTRLLVSVQGTTSKKYKEICGYNLDYDKYLEQIAYFYQHKKECGLYVKTVDVALEDKDDEQTFLEMFKPICDMVCVEQLMNGYSDVDYSFITAKDVDHVARYGGDYKTKVCCDTMFMYMNIHSNGNVDCCGCKYPPLFIGNIFNTPLNKIWNGDVHKMMMEKHLQGKRQEILCCSDCASIESFNTFPNDNLDAHLKEVLERVQRL